MLSILKNWPNMHGKSILLSGTNPRALRDSLVHHLQRYGSYTKKELTAEDLSWLSAPSSSSPNPSAISRIKLCATLTFKRSPACSKTLFMVWKVKLLETENCRDKR